MNREQIDQIVRRVYRRLLLDGKPDAAEGFRQTIIDASGRPLIEREDLPPELEGSLVSTNGVEIRESISDKNLEG
jgi:hypothetical protein